VRQLRFDPIDQPGIIELGAWSCDERAMSIDWASGIVELARLEIMR